MAKKKTTSNVPENLRRKVTEENIACPLPNSGDPIMGTNKKIIETIKINRLCLLKEIIFLMIFARLSSKRTVYFSEFLSV